MLFNSYLFILVFLPAVLLLYFSANRLRLYTAGKCVLLISSLVFIGYRGFYSLLVLLLSLIVNYSLYRALEKAIRPEKKKALLAAGVVFNVLLLGAFKYAAFFADDLRLLFGPGFSSLRILMPLGISFYTFQQISFLVDASRGEIARVTPLDYALGFSFFPKFLQGPIVLSQDLIPQFSDETRKRFCFERFQRGITLFSVGLAKKVLLADNLGIIVDYGHAHIASLNSFEAVLTILAYALQLYLDFSGYCDMGIGVSEMLNIDLPWNFDSPYKARNIPDFWKRWHITLTQFFTKYIYYPLGGNRKGLPRTCVNILIVYLISGLWHGAGYTFLLWGVLHGLASILHRLWHRQYDKLPVFFQRLITFLYVTVAWVFFRASSISAAFSLLRQVFVGGWRFRINAELTESLLMPTLISIPSQFLRFPIVVVLYFTAILLSCALCRNSKSIFEAARPTVKSLLAVFCLFVLSVLSLSGVSGFLYTNF